MSVFVIIFTEMRHDGRDEARSDGALCNGGRKVRGQLRERVADDKGDDGQEIRGFVAHGRRRGVRLRDHLSAQASPVHVLRWQFGYLYMEVGVARLYSYERLEESKTMHTLFTDPYMTDDNTRRKKLEIRDQRLY